MENQEEDSKEKEDAYEYGGFAFNLKEALNLIDNLERSKQILLNDESLKNSKALKTLEHFDIINKDQFLFSQKIILNQSSA